MFEVGDLVRLSVTNRDSTGNPVDAGGAVAVAVTRPDGTAATGLPTVQHTTPGLYWIDFPSTQPGRHLVRWTGGGTAAFGFADVLNVWPADPLFLLSLADARAALGRSQPSVQDDDLRLFMAAVTPVIEDIIGPVVSRPVTETFDGGGSALLLSDPVAAGTTVALTVAGVASSAFTVDYDAGIVYAGSAVGGGVFGGGRAGATVTYTVGGQAVTANVVLAAREEFRFLWENAQGARHGEEDDAADIAYTRSGYAVPSTVMQLLAPAPRLGGFA